MKKIVTLSSIALLVSLVCSGAHAGGPVPDPSYASFIPNLPCAHRIGRCFEASIAGQRVVAIKTEPEYKALYLYAKERNDSVRDFLYWKLDQPVDGKHIFDIVVETNALGKEKIGEKSEEPEIGIYPLQEQALASQAELVASKNVRVGGNAVVAQQQTLTQDELPPGEYVIAITYQGQNRQFDRKHVFVKVK